MPWNVTPIIAGEFGMVRDDIRFKGGNPERSGMVPSYVFLARSSSTVVLIDTSFDDASLCAELLGLRVTRRAPLLENLRRHGIEACEVTAVVLTHLHWDHAANCHLFPRSTIFCQALELEVAFAPVFDDPVGFLESLRRSMDRVVPLSGECELFNGLRVSHCGGHTRGSQMVHLDTVHGTALVTGDTIMTYKNVLDGIPVGLCDDAAECAETLRRVRDMHGAVLLPSHDYRTMKYVSDPESCRVP